MHDPVSVVITCYNLERYIKTAIESVLAQRDGQPLDVVVIDDCSTDASSEIIASYPEVRKLRTQSNSGVLLATIQGMRAANSDIVAFLDGDDVWHPEKIRRVRANFSDNPRLGLLTHDLRYIDGQGNAIHKVSRPHQAMGDHAPEDYDRLVREGILEHTDHVWLGSAYAIRKSAIDAGGFCTWAESLPEPMDTYQDWPLAYWAALKSSAGMGYIPSVLFDYRLHQANHSGDARNQDKAVRNVRRAYNTMHATQLLLDRDPRLLPRARLATRRKLAYTRYLLDLYASRRVDSFRGYLSSQPHIAACSGGIVREFLRFAGVQCLGLSRFLRLSAWLRGQR